MEPKKLPASRQELLIEDPLYSVYDISATETKELARLLYREGALDAYCSGCEQVSVFQVDYRYDIDKVVEELKDGAAFFVSARCVRNHPTFVGVSCLGRLLFAFTIVEKTLVKLGQFPSKADLDFGSLDPVFSKELEPSLRSELGRAIGLRAHDIGVGSFVYLRRIFEAVLEESRQIARNESDWDDARYQSSKVVDRIQMLKAHLPSRLVATSNLYGILSRGVHTLSESECLSAFPLVFGAIQLILKERHEDRAYEKLAQQLQASQIPGPT